MRQKNYGLTDRQRHKGETVFFLSFGAAVKKASTYIGIYTCTTINYTNCSYNLNSVVYFQGIYEYLFFKQCY